jgi:radical SAM superfamily enzyme YgiQ (UPF0313 family)
MEKQKVLLVGMYDDRMVSLAPPMLKSYVQKFPISEKYDIQTTDLSIFSQSTEEHLGIINSHNPDIVGFSSYVWNIPLIEKVAPHLDARIILGGPQCTTLEEEILSRNPNVDCVVSGEGVVTFKELLEYYSGEREFEGILGATNRDIRNPSRPLIQNLDDIPSPYEAILDERPDLEWILYETSKGCPQGCKYCTWSNSRRMRYHSEERVREDLGTILKLPKLKSIYLGDSSILYNRERAKGILDYIHNINPEISVRYEFNATQLNEEIIGYLTKLSGDEFNFGLQTTNPVASKIMNRPFSQDKFEKSYRSLIEKVESPSITVDIIYGLPGDDYEGYKKSLEYALNLEKVSWVLTNPLIMLPGSQFSREKEKHGIEIRDEKGFMVSSTNTFSKEDMEKARKISYLASMVLLNKPLKQAVKELSNDQGEQCTDTISQFFDGLGFKIVPGEYPFMIPSNKEDFKERNLALYHTFNLFPEIIDGFNQFSGNQFKELLSNHEQGFIPKFHSYRKFAIEEAEKEDACP